MQKLGYKLKFGSWIEFAQTDKFLKIKPGSGLLSKYEKLKLWQFYVIYLTVHDRNHELDFCDRFPNLKNIDSLIYKIFDSLINMQECPLIEH